MVEEIFCEELNNQKKVVILNSRQHLGVTGSCEWVKKTIGAVSWVRDQGHVLITSVGIKTWEISLFAAVERSVPVIILIPVSSENTFDSLRSYYCTQFRIDPSNAVFLPVMGSENVPDEQKLRDITAVEMADLILPVSIRKNGSLDRLVSDLEHSSYCLDFKTSYESKGCTQKLCYTDMQVNNEINKGWLSDYLYHWTRSAWKPWPDELLVDYYRDIVHSVKYPRTALKTLEHIFESQIIIGSDRHMPGKQQCVSFTGETPGQFLPLMRWRSRYKEMAFEPYGIGIRKCVALERGVKRVKYIESTSGVNDEDRWLTQSPGKKGDWLLENEYRCKEQFPFTNIDRSDLLVVCQTVSESLHLSEKYGLNAIPMFL
jgi:hypothetical protein